MTTTEADRGLSYRFGPRESSGDIFGLSGLQLGTLFGGLMLAVASVKVLPTPRNLLAAFVVIVATGAAAVGAGELPRLAGFVTGRRRWRHPLAGRALPPEYGKVRILDVEVNGRRRGVVDDNGTAVGLLRVYPTGSFPLMDSDEHDTVLDAAGRLQQALSARSSLLTRFQQLDRTGRRDDDALATYYATNRNPAVSPEADASYTALLRQAAPAAQSHEMLLCAALDGLRARRRVAAAGGGIEGRCRVVVEEMAKLIPALEEMGLRVGEPLTADGVWALFRAAVDPAERARTARRRFGGRPSPDSALALARDDSWNTYRTDGTYARTYWIEQYPRVPVKGDFLSPLLATCKRPRSVSIVLAAVNGKASRQRAERAVSGHQGENLLRDRLRKRLTTHEEAQQQAAASREAEVAAGAALTRVSGYVTVYGSTPGELDDAAADVEADADRAHLSLKVLSADQAAGFIYTLPLARGLRRTWKDRR